MKWKVCGMKYRDNIQDVLALSPHYMGFICYRGSSRYVGDHWEGIPEDFPASTKKVGVFVNEPLSRMKSHWLKHPFDMLQLHGQETVEYCQELYHLGKVIIKAFGIENADDLQQLQAYKPWVHYFLLDTKSKSYGGTGRTFDWKILDYYDNEKPLILSGGISLEVLPEIARLSGLNLAFIDVNSRFESEPGRKVVSSLATLKQRVQEL